MRGSRRHSPAPALSAGHRRRVCCGGSNARHQMARLHERAGATNKFGRPYFAGRISRKRQPGCNLNSLKAVQLMHVLDHAPHTSRVVAQARCGPEHVQPRSRSAPPTRIGWSACEVALDEIAAPDQAGVTYARWQLFRHLHVRVHGPPTTLCAARTPSKWSVHGTSASWVAAIFVIALAGG